MPNPNATPLAAKAGYCVVYGQALRDAAGSLITGAKLLFSPRLASAAPVAPLLPNGNGHVTAEAVEVDIDSTGKWQTYLARTDVDGTVPVNFRYAVTCIGPTGRSLLASGYDCFQPAASEFDFDTFTPGLEGEAEYVVAAGPSAYEVWLAAGNTGTVEQFLAALRGPAGTVPNRGNYSPAATYAAGDTVGYTDGHVYISAIDGNTGHTPSSSPTQWVPLQLALPSLPAHKFLYMGWDGNNLGPLIVSVSDDGTNFTPVPNVFVQNHSENGPNAPNAIWYKNQWVAVLAVPSGNGPAQNVYTSPDHITWSYAGSFDWRHQVSPTATAIYAGHLFVDPRDNTLCGYWPITSAAGTGGALFSDSGFQIYFSKLQNPQDVTSWADPIKVTINPTSYTNLIDASVYLLNGQYVMIVKDESDLVIHVALSSSRTGPFNIFTNEYLLGAGNILNDFGWTGGEGCQLFRIGDRIRVYWDRIASGLGLGCCDSYDVIAPQLPIPGTGPTVLAEYPLNEGSGTTVHDVSGNALNGTFGSVPPTWSSAGLTFARSAFGVHTGTSVSFGSPSAFNLMGSVWMVAAVRPVVAGAYLGRIFAKDDGATISGSSFAFCLEQAQNELRTLAFHGSGLTQGLGLINPASGAWLIVGGFIDPTYVRAVQGFITGHPETGPGPLNATSLSVTMGSDSSADNNFNGDIGYMVVGSGVMSSLQYLQAYEYVRLKMVAKGITSIPAAIGASVDIRHSAWTWPDVLNSTDAAVLMKHGSIRINPNYVDPVGL